MMICVCVREREMEREKETDSISVKYFKLQKLYEKCLEYIEKFKLLL